MAEAHGPGLISTYGLSADKIAFFAAHEARGEKVPPINVFLLARSDTLKDYQRITRALRLSYQFEVMFYGAVMAATPTGK
jgi:hypothetical protein